MARICIEDEEGNFLYLNVGDYGLADSIVTTINTASNGEARLVRLLTADELDAIGPPPSKDPNPRPRVKPRRRRRQLASEPHG